MIPLSLTIKGFLSYREEIHIDFSQLEVVCISGPNGAGKSSLFDAITWVLFGKARQNDDDALINDAVRKMQDGLCRVVLEFKYEGLRYRVERSKQAARGAVLEFQVMNAEGNWKALTEVGLRATEERIRQVLHLDYETFVNSAFFLQGKADLFAQQAPARRKEILGSILGLEVWESYREETTRRRRQAEEDLGIQQKILEEILQELGQEQERVEKLRLLTATLEGSAALRQEKEKAYNQALAGVEKLKVESEKLKDLLARLAAKQERLVNLELQIAQRQADLSENELIQSNAQEIHQAYQNWQALRVELENWDNLAQQYHGLQNERSQRQALIQSEEARLREEQKHLLETQAEFEDSGPASVALETELEADKGQMAALETRLIDLTKAEERHAQLLSERSDVLAENLRLKERMQEIKSNIELWDKADDKAGCPLCGQPLTQDHREKLLEQMAASGKDLGDQYRQNSRLLQANESEGELLKSQINDLKKAQAELNALQRSVGQKDQRVAEYRARLEKWTAQGKIRLEELGQVLGKEEFSMPVRVQLQQVDASIQKLGYQADEHERSRAQEREARVVEEAYRNLAKAGVAVEALRREVATLQQTRQDLQGEISSETEQREPIERWVEEQSAKRPDMNALESELQELRQRENSLRQQVGAAQQMVDVLARQRTRQVEINEEMLSIQNKIVDLRALEIAFGKDGIPALLVEQALPEIEMQANDLLERLSDGRMSVSFATEREYKDKKRDDKKQTLDIIISDTTGQREYELFSGGEAFRINFAIRLALSRVLARRAGARLQTLVVDEGFGSQDAEGRQRLIEAINLVRQDFACILVITHLEELKDTFPSRIEVQKTAQGSIVEVMP